MQSFITQSVYHLLINWLNFVIVKLLVNFTWGSTILYCTQWMGCVRQIPSISTDPSGSRKVGRRSCQAPCSSGSWYYSLEEGTETPKSWAEHFITSHVFTELHSTNCHGHSPWLFSTLSRRPMLCRCLGVDTDRASTSPMASWKPGLAPSRKETGWSLYCRKYWTWPISWCTVIRSSIVTTVHCLILETQTQKKTEKLLCNHVCECILYSDAALLLNPL